MDNKIKINSNGSVEIQTNNGKLAADDNGKYVPSVTISGEFSIDEESVNNLISQKITLKKIREYRSGDEYTIIITDDKIPEEFKLLYDKYLVEVGNCCKIFNENIEFQRKIYDLEGEIEDLKKKRRKWYHIF